jgi:hypothetical protein
MHPESQKSVVMLPVSPIETPFSSSTTDGSDVVLRHEISDAPLPGIPNALSKKKQQQRISIGFNNDTETLLFSLHNGEPVSVGIERACVRLECRIDYQHGASRAVIADIQLHETPNHMSS